MPKLLFFVPNAESMWFCLWLGFANLAFVVDQQSLGQCSYLSSGAMLRMGTLAPIRLSSAR